MGPIRTSLFTTRIFTDPFHNQNYLFKQNKYCNLQNIVLTLITYWNLKKSENELVLHWELLDEKKLDFEKISNLVWEKSAWIASTVHSSVVTPQMLISRYGFTIDTESLNLEENTSMWNDISCKSTRTQQWVPFTHLCSRPEYSQSLFTIKIIYLNKITILSKSLDLFSVVYWN